MLIRRILPVICWFFYVIPQPTTADAQPLTHTRSQRFGDLENYQSASAIATDGANNVFVAGQFKGTVDFGGGPLTDAGGYDIYITKFNAAGNHIWSKRFGDTERQVPSGITCDGAGNVFLVGKFRGTVDFGGGPLTSEGYDDIFVAKFDPAGTPRVEQTIRNHHR